MPVKIFIGNLVEDADQNEIRQMFERFGVVGECVVFKNYGFVVSILRFFSWEGFSDCQYLHVGDFQRKCKV